MGNSSQYTIQSDVNERRYYGRGLSHHSSHRGRTSATTPAPYHVLIIIINSCFECLTLDVPVSPLNCFYQRFVTYLVWRSLKRPIEVTLLNLGLAARDITLSALRTTERLKFW